MNMNTSELFVAIEAAYRMLHETNKYADDWPLLLEHLKTLLAEQEKRATRREPT